MPKYNISFVLKNDLCVGCGICEDICPSGTIKIEPKNNRFMPTIKNKSCVSEKGCRKCLESCPGLGVNLEKISSTCFDNKEVKCHSLIGRYQNCYVGHSTNEALRYHSASGGSLSQFLIWLIKKNIIEGAIVTKFSPNDQFLVKTFIAKTTDEILSAKSSKYSPVSMNGIINQIKKSDGKYIIVGLPCHIHGFRKYETIDSQFKQKILGYFSLYCSGGRTFGLTEFVFEQNKIKKNKLNYLAYRDEGCLGYLVAKLGSIKIRIPYKQYYHPLRSFYIPRRCLTCVDLYGELSDVSFGDIHLGKYKIDKIGINSIIVRSPVFNEYLSQAIKDGVLNIENIEADYLVQAQKNLNIRKKKSVATFLQIEKFLGKKGPHYDIHLLDHNVFKSVISYFGSRIQMFIGKHKKLWFIIKFITLCKR